MAVKVETKAIKENTGSLIFWKSPGGRAHNPPALSQRGVAPSVILSGAEKDNEVAAAFRPMGGELEESHVFEAFVEIVVP